MSEEDEFEDDFDDDDLEDVEEDERDPKLEAEFKKALTEAQDKMKKHLEKAELELDKAVEISEEYGVPLEARISPIWQTYTPESYYDKFSDLSQDFLDEEGIYLGEYDGSGWEHSDVC